MNEKVRGEYEKYAVIMIALLIMLIGGCSAGNKSLSDGSSETALYITAVRPKTMLSILMSALSTYITTQPMN